MNTEIKFRTYDDLLIEVLQDFRIIEEEGMIEPAVLIKVAQRVNYDLGLRINQTKETILHVENHVAKLPEDFYVLEFALLLGHHRELSDITWGGRVTENIDVSCSGVTACTNDPQFGNFQCCLAQPNSTCFPGQDPFAQNRVFSMCNGNKCVKVIEKRGVEVREYTYFDRLYIKNPRYLDPGSINKFKQDCADEAEIKNGYLYITGRDACRVYLSYKGSLEDEEGNLLVLDHPMINEYYQNALKVHILENLYYSGEEVKEKLMYAKEELKMARLQSLTIVNTPDFAELVSTWAQNRKIQSQRFYHYWHTNVFHERWHGIIF